MVSLFPSIKDSIKNFDEIGSIPAEKKVIVIIKKSNSLQKHKKKDMKDVPNDHFFSLFYLTLQLI